MKRLSFLISFATTLLFGCNKSFESFTSNPNGTDTIWSSIAQTDMSLNQLYKDLAINPFVDSISILTGGIIHFPNNAEITIQPNSFLLNGTSTDGKATVQFQLLTKKGDMVRMGKPTQSNGYLLESGGEIFVDVNKNGQSLTLASGKQIKISYYATFPNPMMKGFIGIDATNPSGPNSVFNWSLTDSLKVAIALTPIGYQVFTNNLHWISCDYFNDTSATKTTIALTMPLGFTNMNTAVFIIYKNSNSVMQFEADATNKIWIKNKVPLNKDVTFLSITKQNNDYYLGTSSATTSLNLHVVLKPVKIKLPELINYLGSL